MYTSLVNQEAVDLLSRITAKNLAQRDVTLPVVFLASLTTVLLGVIFMDGKVAEEEKNTLLKTLYRFSSSDSDVRKLTHQMIKGVKENHLYRKSDDLLALTSSLTESQLLLLISFGYEMSAADGDMDSREKNYLEMLSKRLNIKPQYLGVFEAAFTNQENINSEALEEVRFLLEPLRFQELDTVFVKAARDILKVLPSVPEKKSTRKSISVSYDGLKKFQEYRQQLENICNPVFQILQDCQKRNFISETFLNEAQEIWKKNKSERFRLAVVGEFSQGKSTLLNALLGEEIQPVREIPCSSTVTVLRYGKQKRVVCLYKDGREEEISFDMYQQKASLSEDAAIDCLSDELSKSEIEEIIFEHPDLELCKSGVEIVDSPGLNEHPQRTAITQKLLKETDAVIFMTNASRPLTQGERDLLHEVKLYLSGSKDDAPVHNLFIACNFIDLIRTETGKKQIQQRIKNFVQGNNPLIAGENRVHFISAQAAFDSIIKGSEDEYLKDFNYLITSIENFLIFECGDLKRKRWNLIIHTFNQKCDKVLEQAQKSIEGKINISEADKQKIIEKIGEISGSDIKIYYLANKLKQEASAKAIKCRQKWHDKLSKAISTRSKSWHSEHSPVWSQDKLIQDYTNQFIRDLSLEIDDWGNKILKDIILKKYIEFFDINIKNELDTIQADLKTLDIQVNSNFGSQLKLSIDSIKDDFMGFVGIGGGIGIGGALAAGLLVFTGVGFIAVIVTSVAATIAGSFGLGILDMDGLHDQIKNKISQEGLKNFDDSIDKIDNKINEIIDKVFDNKVESVRKITSQAISFYENLLEQQENASEETIEEFEADKTWISQKRQELERIQQNIKSIIKI